MLMSDEDYLTTQQQLTILAGIVDRMDIDAFLKRLGHAEAFGPVLDPTLHRAAMPGLASVRHLAEAAHTFQGSIREALRKEQARDLARAPTNHRRT